MATIRIYDDQENRITETRRGKENALRDHHQGHGVQQKRAVLGVLHNNCHRNKPENSNKDEKFAKVKAFLPPQLEPFKVYEEKRDTAPFQIYEEKEEQSINHRETRDGNEIHTKHVIEINIKSEQERPVLEVNPVKIVPKYRPVLQEITTSTKQEDADYNHGSPMSLEKSLVSVESATKERKKCDIPKAIKNSFYDVDEYREDIYNYLRVAETNHRPKPGYMKKQPDITYEMRAILVDWLVEVAEEYRLQSETLYLAVSYVDRFLSYMSVVRAKLQLVGTAAMFIAAKYEEIYAPDVGEFVYITDDTYSKKQVLRMEHLILRVLSFDLTVPTPLTFLKDLCISNNLSEKVLFLAMYLCELSLLEADDYLQFLPSHLAAAAVAVARHTLQEEAWPHELELSTGYSFQDLKECIRCLCETFANAPTLPQQAIQEKYKSRKYGHVALLLPRSTNILSYDDDSESA
ncbi:G2/mitotic-specific cyclin-A [Chelonus insularis]|uniref:G2/mitotic-specific cyclin-A n=1 Tax=Chelonus insularis TaxID=460826 RepID=UPI00158E6142|nr:G2/mitotic-specific cyclin-A [Chelonus insularis]